MRVPVVSLLAVLASARSLCAQPAGLTMDHAGIACMVAGKHPIVTARVAPEDQVARARVFFRGGGHTRWYHVDMTSADGVFRGTLPKPTLQLKTVEYYVDGLGRTLAEARSANHAPRVVPDEASCRGEALLLLADQARVVIGGVSDGAPVPEGFSADGVVGAAAVASAPKKGGMSGKTVGLGLVGLGAIGGAIAAASGGGGDDGSAASGPSPASSPTTPSTPAPGGTTVTFEVRASGMQGGFCEGDLSLDPKFRPRSSGRADLSLSFVPQFEHQLKLEITPDVPVSAGSPIGRGPVVNVAFQVDSGREYTVSTCGTIRPDDPRYPLPATLRITHP